MEGKGKEGKEGKQGKQGKEGIEGKEGKNHMSLLKQRIAEARMRREKGGAVEGEKMEGMRALRAAGQAKSGQREVLPQGREKEMVGRSDDDAREKEVMDMVSALSFTSLFCREHHNLILPYHMIDWPIPRSVNILLTPAANPSPPGPSSIKRAQPIVFRRSAREWRSGAWR